MIRKIQLRRGTETAWTNANPMLSAGEVGFEINTGKFKIGDGTTVWNSLPYAGAGELTDSAIIAALGYTPADATALGLKPSVDPAIAALTGPNSLAAIITTTLPLGHVFGCVINGVLSFYQLNYGTDAQSLPGIVRPGDFHTTTNPRVWKQVL